MSVAIQQRNQFALDVVQAAVVVDRNTLPPDADALAGGSVCDNDQRSGFAEKALKAYHKETGSDFETAIADLICDLGHFCDRHGLKLAEEIDRAIGMYGEETHEKGEQFI